MQQISIGDLVGHVGKTFENAKGVITPKLRAELERLLMPALDQHPDNPALWFYIGLLYNHMGVSSLAAVCWQKSYELEPQPSILSNLGASLKGSANPEKARDLLKRASLILPYEPSTITNLLGTYVNEGEPWEGIDAGRDAMKAGLNNRQLMFNLALLELEAGNYAEGFELYADGIHEMRDIREYEGAARFRPGVPKGSRLLVYGEQGIGDELMFSTMFCQAAEDYEIWFDHHPRLTELYASAPWADKVKRFPTRKAKADWYKPGLVDFSCPIADLARVYRRTPESFAWQGPHFKAQPAEVEHNRRVLEAVGGGKKIIGLSLRGGTIKTSRTYRSLPFSVIEPLLEHDDCLFVSLDYDDVSDVVMAVQEKYGEGKFLWFPSIAWAWDYVHMANLIAACDKVVTVCQSAAHLSAAMGVETHVMTPWRAAWRYGLGRNRGDAVSRQGEPWYWYPSGKTFMWRQDGEDWSVATKRIAEVLNA